MSRVETRGSENENESESDWQIPPHPHLQHPPTTHTPTTHPQHRQQPPTPTPSRPRNIRKTACI